jgi:spore maturation protein CgeB
MARPLYCAVDSQCYSPKEGALQYDLGYMGTYSADRQEALDSLLLKPAQHWPEGRFVVAGPQYPASIQWPDNIARLDHVLPTVHRDFYNAQRFTLNLTRAEMRQAGFAPSVRLFEAAACATPIISDYWPGLETFFTLGIELLVSRSSAETLRYLRELPPEARWALGTRARERVLAEHTAAHRAEIFEEYVLEARATRKVRP